MKWHEATFGEFFDVRHGYAFQSKYFSDEGDYILLTPGNFRDEGGFKYKDGKEKFYSGDIPEEYVLKQGDLLVAMTEQAEGLLGSSAWIPSDNRFLHNQRLGLIANLDERRLDKAFLYYLFNTRPVRSQIKASASGTKVRHTAPERIAKVKFTRPPIATQRHIASILSAYDDLIENNLRRIKLLEESARLLYKEWFIRLRFPGHEHTRIVSGVPKGWERVSLKDLCESIDYGFTASAQEEEVGPKLLRITDIVPAIIDWSSVPYCEIPDGKREKYLLKEGDIVVARTGATVGYAKRLHRRHPQAIFASYLVRLRISPHVDNILVGIFVESEYYKAYVKAQIGGAAQPNANAQVLTRATLLLPPAKMQKWFREIEEPLFDQKELLQVENQKLRQGRDILLPKLMSAEMEV